MHKQKNIEFTFPALVISASRNCKNKIPFKSDLPIESPRLSLKVHLLFEIRHLKGAKQCIKYHVIVI